MSLINNHATDLVVALDFPRADRAMELVDTLKGLQVIYKVGYELFVSGGPDLVRELVHRKNRVFLDLKFHDIPNTVSRVARQAALLHVDMFTVHIAGGGAMVRAVVQEMSAIPLLRPKVIGVSVLTSFDDLHWAEVTRAMTGHATDVADSVSGLVSQGAQWGADGVVCSALELSGIRKAYPTLFTVVPGIRPTGSPKNDQARIMTPAEARASGAHAIVMGRPITEAPDPRQVVERTLGDLSASVSAPASWAST